MAEPTVDRLASFMGRSSGDPDYDEPPRLQIDEEQAGAVLTAVTAMCRAYTRANGFTTGKPCDEIEWGVIYSAAARLMVASPNPQANTYEVHGPDSFRHDGTPVAFSVAELMVLDRYRVKAL